MRGIQMSSKLLPHNSTKLERAVADLPQLERMMPEIIASLWNPYLCPIGHLPWLAWALSVDEWDEEWDEATQRRVVASSIEIHRQKGTVGAVKKALVSLGHSGKIVEWWQMNPRGVPHTFRADVEIDNRGIDETSQSAIERAISSVKPVRSHFMLRMVGKSTCSMYVASCVVAGDNISIMPHQITMIDPSPTAISTGVAIQEWGAITVYPR